MAYDVDAEGDKGAERLGQLSPRMQRIRSPTGKDVTAFWRFMHETARALVELGADINAVDREGRRPLTEAKARGVDAATVEFLVAHGAHE